MSFRMFNGLLVPGSLVLWGASTYWGFIGNTAFIGHISMAAIVLSAMAAWRADVPDDQS